MGLFNMPSRQDTSRGFSIIELMIASLIGLFVIGGILVIYIASIKSFEEREQLSILDNIGRNALYELTQGVEHTGYHDDIDTSIIDYFISSTAVPESCVDKGINDTGTNIADATILAPSSDNEYLNNDAIGVVFLASTNLNQDCSGETLPTDCEVATVSVLDASKIYNSYVIRNVNDVPELQCGGSLSTTRTTLVSGVEKLQVLYGVDMDADAQIDNFMNATQVTLANAWARVLAVQVAVLVRSPKPFYEKPVTKSYVLLDEIIEIPADRYLRAVYTKTIRLQNMSL